MHLYKDHFIKTLSLAFPVIIGQLGFMMMGVVDSIMVGRLGAIPLAAAALGSSITILIFIIGIGSSIAVTPLVAILVGAKRFEECGVYFRQSLIVNTIISLFLFLATYFSSYLIAIINQPIEVIPLAESYTRILAFSVFAMMIFQTYKQFIEGLSIMRPAMIVALAANIINAFSNWIFIYGNLGSPALGLDGAGIATLMSRIFMAVTLMFYVMKSKHFSAFDVSLNFNGFNFPVIKKILNLGIPSGFQYFFETGAFVFAIVMVGWIGANELAAHQIAINLASISFMMALGISQAGSIRVGNAVGQQNITEVRRAGFIASILGGSVMMMAGIIFITLNTFLPSLYIDDIKVIEIASVLLIIAAFFQIADGVQAVGIGILRGLTDVKGPTIITFVAYWVIGLPSGYLLGFIFDYGVEGVWIGLSLGLFCSAIFLTLRFNYKSRHPVTL
ncbi:MAG: MATE family efflux transporter [Ignavibacteriaceae bacterium]|nr:MATE family efflux transporter [Ignavibacteriaceae bacterium]